MEVLSVFITEAHKGIGLEFVRQLVKLPRPPRYVFAAYKNNDTGIQELVDVRESSENTEVILLKMDITKPDEVKDAREIVKETVEDDGLTLLINNIEVRQMQPFPYVSRENLLYHFTVNTVGPIMVFQELYSSLLKAAGRKDVNSGMSVNRAMVLNIIPMSGSITRTGKEFVQDLVVPGYKISKAALNMAMRNFAANVKEQSILVIMMCPGWVKKDAGTNQGEIEVEESVSSMLQTLTKLNEKHQGAYIDRNGNEYVF